MNISNIFTRFRLSIFVMVFALGMQSCSRDNHPPLAPAEQQKQYSLSYGPDTRNKLDIYLPANRNSATPFVLLIHGGAWVEGDKADFNFLQDSLMAEGIASASISYRYASGTVHYQELMADVGLALNYCYNKSTEWNIRKDKYIICGFSAGAHMALLYGYQYDNSNRIGGIISASGPTDISQADWLNYAAVTSLLDEIQLMVGATYTFGQPLDPKFTDASPIHHIKNVPTLILHGTADPLVPYVQAQNLSVALASQNITQRLVTFENGGHDLGVTNNPAYYNTMMTEIKTWCKTYGK